MIDAAISSWLGEVDPTWGSLVMNHGVEVFQGLGLAGVRAGISKVGS